MGGGGGFSQITASDTFTFTAEDNVVIKTISTALLTNTNFRGFSVVHTETTDTSLDDFTLNGITFNIENIVNNTSFDIRANAINNATGTFTITYKVLYS